jgi:hypothetical protein
MAVGLDPFESDKKAVEAKNKKLSLKRQNDLEDLKKVLQTDHGRRVLKNFLIKTKVFEASYTGNSDTFYNEGKRSIGRDTLNDIHEAAPELVPGFFEELLKKDIE